MFAFFIYFHCLKKNDCMSRPSLQLQTANSNQTRAHRVHGRKKLQ